MRIGTALLLGLVCLSMPIVGCGKKPARLGGTITWNGKPVDGGAISFQPIDKPERQVGSPIESDGSFQISIPADLTDATFKVLIQAARKTGRQVKGQSIDQPDRTTYEYEQSPIHYWDKSDFTIQVSSGQGQTLNFDVQGNAEKRRQ